MYVAHPSQLERLGRIYQAYDDLAKHVDGNNVDRRYAFLRDDVPVDERPVDRLDQDAVAAILNDNEEERTLNCVYRCSVLDDTTGHDGGFAHVCEYESTY